MQEVGGQVARPGHRAPMGGGAGGPRGSSPNWLPLRPLTRWREGVGVAKGERDVARCCGCGCSSSAGAIDAPIRCLIDDLDRSDKVK